MRFRRGARGVQEYGLSAFSGPRITESPVALLFCRCAFGMLIHRITATFTLRHAHVHDEDTRDEPKGIQPTLDYMC